MKFLTVCRSREYPYQMNQPDLRVEIAPHTIARMFENTDPWSKDRFKTTIITGVWPDVEAYQTEQTLDELKAMLEAGVDGSLEDRVETIEQRLDSEDTRSREQNEGR